jgi:Ca2+-transporting ATPase
MSGTEIEELDDPSLDHIVKTIRVFARVSPEHKYRIVESLKRNNEIVAMTGDGANDAPALKTADVGIAMGITGTDVTKDAASMILTDDNFASIVNAVEEGRVVYENIKKGIKFLLTTNMGEVITILLSMILILSHDLIFTPIMILWVNLVTDGTLTVALAYEPKESDVMKRPPRDIKEKFLDRLLLTNILVISVIMALSVLFIFNIYGNISSISPVTSDPLIRRETLAFTMLAVTQIFNAISSRSQRESIFKIGFRKNMVFVYGLIASLGLQVIAVHLYFFNGILSTTPLTLLDWLIILGIGSSVLFIDEIRKYFIRRKSTSIN